MEEAVAGIAIGRRFYEIREEGIGVYYVASVMADVTSLRLYAGIHNGEYGYFKMLAKRFPFAVYYEIKDDVVRVIAVLDMRRDPESIRTVLAKR